MSQLIGTGHNREVIESLFDKLRIKSWPCMVACKAVTNEGERTLFGVKFCILVFPCFNLFSLFFCNILF